MTAAAKGYKGIGMNGMIASWYATNATKRMEQYKGWAENAAGLIQGSEVLEVAPGPGYFSIELARLARIGHRTRYQCNVR